MLVKKIYKEFVVVIVRLLRVGVYYDEINDCFVFSGWNYREKYDDFVRIFEVFLFYVF